MPRTFRTAIAGELAKQYAGEPMLIVAVAWNGANFVPYADRKLTNNDSVDPRVVNVGAFDTTTVVTSGSDSRSVQIILDDTDGAVRAVIDQQDVHLRPVRLYLTFQGLPLEEKALLFEGVINSPLVWNESDRTLTFSVLSKLEESEAGFTMEDGNFPFVPPSERNKAWPLVFGQVCNMEAVQVTALRKGFLAQGLGVLDPTIAERLCQAYYLQCPLITEVIPVSRGWTLGTTQPTYTVEEIAACRKAWRDLGIRTDSYIGGGQQVDLCGGSVLYFPTVRSSKPDPQCVSRKSQEICAILQEKALQESYVVNPFIVRGGEDFPQGTTITIEVEEVRFEGVMTGESFLVSRTFHPQEETIDNPDCIPTPSVGLGYRLDDDYDNPPLSIAECEEGGTKYQQDIRDGAAASWEYYESFEKGDFIWLPPGSEVRLTNESDLVHIVSLLPGVVDQVAAYRTYGDTSLLTELETDMYTVHLEDYGGYTDVEIWLDQPLSSIEDKKWGDTLYVSFTSSVGPNPVDIIEYLVNKYTDYTIDTTSFTAVGTSLTNYPSNFYVKSRPNVMTLIKDIAYQARCAIFIRDNVVYITYLPVEPASLKTLTESDILIKTFSFSHTPTERLQTQHLIKWKEGDAGINKDDPVDLQFTLKYNVPKYGIFEGEYDYFTYNIFELAEKSATFWMIRKANTWRYVEFETPVKHLNLDVFDCVTIDIAQFPTTKVIIEETVYNADSNTIKFKAWTPIRSGETSPYYWAWPSQQVSAVFPLLDDNQASGDGTGITVIPPTDHPLYGGYDSDTAYIATDGDKYPSDLDDSLPTLSCKLATGAEIADDIEPRTDVPEPLAEKNFQDKLTSIENKSTNVNNPDEKENKGACGKPGWQQLGCEYEVTVLYVSPITLTTQQPPAANCNSGGPCERAVSNGLPCTGTLWQMCHSFGALFAARFFSVSKKAEAEQLWDSCGYNYETPAVYTASDPKAIPCEDCVSGDCEDTTGGGDPTAPGADTGQIKKPQCLGGTGDDPGPDNCPGDDEGTGKSGSYEEEE